MKKNTYFLIVLFLLLLIIAFIVLQRPGEQSVESAGSGPLFIIDSLAVDKIEIKTPVSSVVLQKRGSYWFLTSPLEYRANQTNVAHFIHQVKALEVKNIISDKPEKHGIFQVDRSGTAVTIYENGAEKAAFVVGKMAAGYTESYVRRSASNDVLLVEGAYVYTFNRPVKEWRDKSIFSDSKEDIREINFQYGDTSFALSLKDSIWYVGKQKARKNVVDGIVSSLSSLQADDFFDSSISLKPTAMITVSGTQIRYSLNGKTEKYYVQSSASPQWFIQEPWRANQILKRKKEIVETGGRR
jgi:hypothetical protein